MREAPNLPSESPDNPLLRGLLTGLRLLQIGFWSGYGCVLIAGALTRNLLRTGRLSRAACHRAIAMGLRGALEGLGATFIKLGQIASTRPDLLPAEYIAELVQLQENVRPFPTATAQAIIEQDFDAPLAALFSQFEERPLAAASVAQVHRARLLDGAPVAVKVLRPSLAAWARFDQSIALCAARLVELIPSMRMLSPVHAVGQFCTAINQQLDFRLEAAHNRRFRENFSTQPEVVFPTLIERLCSARVLTMELVEGVRDTELAQAGIDPRQVAALGLRVFCKMVFLDGFLHADLHPGNLRFLPGGRLALFDLGLVAELSPTDRLMLAQTMYYMSMGMAPELARHMYQLCQRLAPVDYAAYEAAIAAFVRRFVGRPLGEIELSAAIGSFFDIFRRFGMRLDGRYTVVNVSFVVVEGLGKKLDPKIDITAEARPFLEAAVRDALAALMPGMAGAPR